jgi:hypothetical protein
MPRGAPAHVQNSVQMSERTDRKVQLAQKELLEQFSSERTELIEHFFLNELNFWNSSAQSELN